MNFTNTLVEIGRALSGFVTGFQDLLNWSYTFEFLGVSYEISLIGTLGIALVIAILVAHVIALIIPN